MKKYLFLLTVSLFAKTGSNAQIVIDSGNNYRAIYLPNYYKEEGIIFSKDFVVRIDMNNMKNRYTPSISDVSKMEEIFNKEFRSPQGSNIPAKDLFRKYVRQYIGLIDSNGNKNIIVQLIDNKNPRKIKRLLGKQWKTNFIVMLGDGFYAVSTRYRINIDTGELSNDL